MNKAQQMLAKAGFPDTAAGRAAFHKQYPTPESFFQVHGGQDTEMYDAGSTIHIDPSKRGTFTAAATKHGKSVQGFASQVLANKEDYSSAMVKKANFARNAASWKHEDGNPVMYANGSTVGGGDDEPWRKDIKPEMYILDTDENGNPVGRKPPELPRHKSNYGMSNFMGNVGSKIGDFAENIGDINIDPQLAFRPVKQRGFSFDNTTDVEIESGSHNNANTNFGITVPGMHIPAMFTTVRANAPGTAGLYGKFTPSVMSSNAEGVGQNSTGQTELGFSPRINLTKHKLLSDRNRGDATVQFQPSIYGGAGYDTPQGGTLFNGNSDIQPFKGGNIGTYYGGKAKLNLNLGDMGGNSDMTFHANPYLSYDSRRGSQVGVDVGTNSSWPKGGREEYNISGGYNFDTKRPFIGAHISLPLMRQRPAYRDIPLKQLNFGFADGGTVDALQLMGMPTPPMYNYGSHVTDYSPSYEFGGVQSDNTTYRHGFANGGRVGMYGFGSTIKDLGYGMADMSLGTIGGLTGIQSMQDIVDEDQYSNDKFDDVVNLGGKIQSAVVKNIPGVGQVVGAVGGGLGTLANTAFKIDERNYDPSQHTGKLDKIGNFVGMAGDMASMFTNPASAASSLSKGAKTAMNVGKIAGLGATAFKAGQDIDKSQGGTYDPTNLLNLGMGVARSGFFGGNTNTSNNFTNTKGAVDYTPTMDTPLYAAMGGAVNAPNMMKYDAGSNVPNQGNISLKDQYNLLLKAKPVTKYFSPAMPFHPKDGSMDPRGTVVGSIDPQTGEPIEINIEKNEARWKLPNNTDFITTKKNTDKILTFDKNNDGIAKVTAMLNTTFDKNKKAAKQGMMRQGGMVGQYGYGGGVRMFAAGGPPGPLEPSENTGYVYNFGEEDPSAAVNMYDFDASTPFNIMNVGMYGTQPSRYYSASNPNIYPSPNAYGNPAAAPVYNAGNVTGYTPTNFRMPSVGAPNKNAFITSQVYGTNPNTSYGQWNAQNAPTSPVGPAAPAQDLQDSQGPLGNRGYYDFPDTPDTPSAPPINNPYAPIVTDAETTTPTPSWFSRNKQDLGTAAGKTIMYSPALYNIGRSLSKPFQMNAADYQVKEDIKPYEEEYRPDYRTYNAAVANLNRMPGSGNLAARTNLFNAMQQQQDDARFKIGLGNAQRKMTADQSRLTRKEKDLNIAMQIAQFNQQNKEVPGNMLAQGLGDASQAYQFERFNKLSANAMGNIMQHFTMLPDGTMVPKTGYNPAAYNSIYNAGNTPTINSYDPNLISPNRYVNQGVGIRTNNRFIPNFKTIDPNQFNLFDK